MAPIMSLHVTHMHMIPIIYVVLDNSQSLRGRTGAMLFRETERE